MKKVLTLALVGAMLAATSITAFAETTNVSYDFQPSYTVSIPADVTLSDTAVTADITASNVILEDGKQIKVDLTAASNTASGSTFNAKNGDSTVTYTITGDSTIAVGDTVATFTADGSKTLTFSAADKSAATAAGAHTETLTFTISVAGTGTGFSLSTNSIATPGRGETNYLTVTGASAENPVYFTGAYTGSATTESIPYYHGTAGSYDELYFNGAQIYHGNWDVGSALEITGGTGTQADPYVLNRV